MNFLNVVKTKISKTLWKIQRKTSADYWDQRYSQGGNSGSGSYNELAQFKAKVIQNLVDQHHIQNVIEFGSGDGNQLKYISYPKYSGYDISPTAIKKCQELFKNDLTKKFDTLNNYSDEKADLSLSLDVIYHLVEDSVYFKHLTTLFESSTKFVLIYSSNYEASSNNILPEHGHVKHRHFTAWIEKNQPQWKLISKIDNEFKYNPQDKSGSLADFYLYEKR